jgi:7-dehydrocholesterol reductase
MAPATRSKRATSDSVAAPTPSTFKLKDRSEQYDVDVKEWGAFTFYFRTYVAPLLLMLITPFLAVLFYTVTMKYGASYVNFVVTFDFETVRNQLPLPSLRAAAVIIGWIAAQGFLLAFIPGAAYLGPVTPGGNRPQYKLNGVASYLISLAVLGAAYFQFGVPIYKVYDWWGEILSTLTVYSFIGCFVLYLKGLFFPTDSDSIPYGKFVFDFYYGVELHPRGPFGINLKQWINCRIGMVGWIAAEWCFAAWQHHTNGHISNSMLVSVGVQTVYILKFFLWEDGYFGSIDIMHDKLGFYIFWGIMAWVPALYTLIAFYLASHPIAMPTWFAIATFLGGLLSIYLNWDADVQRMTVRRTNGNCLIWGKKPETIEAHYETTDGKKHKNLLLVSGWWGTSRHFHYIAELSTTFFWTLPALFEHILPWSYLIFLTILLVDRSGRDEHRCSRKYGSYWEQYKKKVPYKIVPFVY